MNAYRAGAPLAAPLFAKVRHRMLLEHCKWDPQVGDASTLANFALIMPRPTWQTLAAWAEALSAEASCAERELAERPELLEALGLPRRLLGALRGRGAVSAPRAFRYDFHLTRDGWRISECNADVPGGYAEGSELPALMAEHYPGLSRAGGSGRSLGVGARARE